MELTLGESEGVLTLCEAHRYGRSNTHAVEKDRRNPGRTFKVKRF